MRPAFVSEEPTSYGEPSKPVVLKGDRPTASYSGTMPIVTSQVSTN